MKNILFRSEFVFVCLQNFFTPWQWIHIFFHYCVQLPVVDTKAIRTVLLLHHHNRRSPGGVRWLDYIRVQHAIDFFLNDVTIMERNTPHWDMYRCGITSFDRMIEGCHITQVVFTKRDCSHMFSQHFMYAIDFSFS